MQALKAEYRLRQHGNGYGCHGNSDGEEHDIHICHGGIRQIGESPKANHRTNHACHSKQYASLAPGQLIESITLEEAIKLFELPRVVGSHEGIEIICTKGRFGPYIKYGDRNVSLPKGTDPLKVDLATCIELISDSRNKKAGEVIFHYESSDIQVINGAYGPYIKHAGSNYRIPKELDPATLTEDKCKDIIAGSEPTGRKKRRK